MAVLPIRLIGDPVLRQPCRQIGLDELAKAETQEFIDDLIETMRAANGAGSLHRRSVICRDRCRVHRRQSALPLQTQFSPDRICESGDYRPERRDAVSLRGVFECSGPARAR